MGWGGMGGSRAEKTWADPNWKPGKPVPPSPPPAKDAGKGKGSK